jgi:hypothetical protein
MHPELARFGVEIEAVLPAETAHDQHTYAAKVLQKALGGERRGQSVFDDDGREWKVEHDGSLPAGGFEVVTPVLTPKDIPTVQRVAKALEQAGAESNGFLGAGLHVHVSHPTQRQRLPAIAREAGRLDESISRHPGRGTYAEPIPQDFLDSLSPDMADYEVLERWYAIHGEPVPDGPDVDKRSITRYHGVNLHALPYQETIEVRAFDGTLDPERIKQAILQSLKMITTRVYKNGRKRRKRGRR